MFTTLSIQYLFLSLQVSEVPDAGEYYHDHSFVKISDSFSTKGYGFGASRSKRFPRTRITSLAGPGRYESQPTLSTKFVSFHLFHPLVDLIPYLLFRGVSSAFKIPVFTKHKKQSDPGPGAYEVCSYSSCFPLHYVIFRLMYLY